MMDCVAEMNALTRYFGQRAAVRDLSLRVPRGSVFALLGRNGAGKTTLIRMLLGLLEPTRGRATLFEHDSRNLPLAVRARVGYLAESHPAFRWMTVAEHVRFQSRHYPRWRGDVATAVLRNFRIDENTKVEHLSRGQRAGLCLALTLATEPEMLILDDPALGLDPVVRRGLLEAIVNFTRREGRTVIISSHALLDVERVADHIAVLDRGALRACCTVETFRKNVRQFAVHFEHEPPELAPFPGLLATERHPRELRVTFASQELPPPLRGFASNALEEIPMSLEDAIVAYLGDRGERTFALGEQE